MKRYSLYLVLFVVIVITFLSGWGYQLVEQQAILNHRQLEKPCMGSGFGPSCFPVDLFESPEKRLGVWFLGIGILSYSLFRFKFPKSFIFILIAFSAFTIMLISLFYPALRNNYLALANAIVYGFYFLAIYLLFPKLSRR